MNRDDEFSYVLFMSMLVGLNSLERVTRTQVLSAVVAACCGDGREGNNGLIDRAAAMKFYDTALRKAVISGFDLIDSMTELGAEIEANTATKQ